ncbi:hypothetical protein NPIL_95481 [Nephila pilipes]|uniref:Uncharacterized protein n=1 Tax=Nephila pilipes TaxID=299642 RepID=A0A8X6UVG2_NEPPI|nr:hypothetical protein NPIL_95481 [Nephila pilipes]
MTLQRFKKLVADRERRDKDRVIVRSVLTSSNTSLSMISCVTKKQITALSLIGDLANGGCGHEVHWADCPSSLDTVRCLRRSLDDIIRTRQLERVRQARQGKGGLI